MSKENEIKNLMEKLSLSYDEAIELWNCDNGIETNEEQNNLDNKAKSIKINHEATDKTKRKKKEYVRKIDTKKLELLTDLKNYLETKGIKADIIKEIELNFILENDNYTLKLIRHNKKIKKENKVENPMKIPDFTMLAK